MARIVLTLWVDFDEVDNIDIEADVLKTAIQNRIFGEGVFAPDTIVDQWGVRTEIITPI